MQFFRTLFSRLGNVIYRSSSLRQDYEEARDLAEEYLTKKDMKNYDRAILLAQSIQREIQERDNSFRELAKAREDAKALEKLKRLENLAWKYEASRRLAQ